MTASSTDRSDRSRLKGFDGIRAVAVTLVFIEHKVIDSNLGAPGVWTFFCLSGFLIVGILQRERAALEAGSGPGGRVDALRAFWRNRALRILPLYYGTLIAIFAATHWLSTPELLWYLAYLQNFYIGLVSHAWGHATHFWSLAVEQQFYLLAAPTLLWIAAAKHLRIVTTVFWACIAFILASIAADWDSMTVSLMPCSTFAFMAIGGMLVLSADDAPLSRALGNGATLIASTALLSAIFVATWEHHPQGIPQLLYFPGLLFSGSLVCFVARRQESRLVALLELPPLRWLGRISYGFYVYHYFMPGAAQLSARLPIDLSAFGYYGWACVQLAASLLLSHLSFVYFERPLLALKRRERRAGSTRDAHAVNSVGS